MAILAASTFTRGLPSVFAFDLAAAIPELESEGLEKIEEESDARSAFGDGPARRITFRWKPSN